MFIDFTAIIAACFMSTLLLSLLDIAKINPIKNYLDILLFSSFSVIGLYIMGAYRIVWRYAQMRNFINCIFGIIVGACLYVVVCMSIKRSFSEITYAFSVCIALILVCLSRIVYAYLYSYISGRNLESSSNRVMIVGAGEGGRHVCHMMQLDKQRFNPVVFIDDDSNKIGRLVNSVPVKGNTNEIPKIAREMNIREIVIAIPSISPKEKLRILNICSETLCKVSILPQIDGYVHNESLKKQMKPIKIEDLLGRDVVSLDNRQTMEMIRDKVCMITGGGGSIGSELARQVASMKPKKLVVVDIYENNAYNLQQELLFEYRNHLNLDIQIASVRDKEKMEKLFIEFHPDIVFHAAAHKHVPLMETNPEEAVKNNIFGTLNVAMLAKKYKTQKFVLVSTDKAVNPTNIMGATKRCCEMIVECMSQKKDKTEFVAVRFGNVLGSNGSVIPLFEKQIANGGPVTVTAPKIKTYFMTIPEAASLILQAATMARGGEIFVLDMGEPVKILKLAEDLIKLHGYKPYVDIDIAFTGLRPGEKLYEELLMNEEGLKKTANNKIFIGHQVEIDEDKFFESLEQLGKAAGNNDKELLETLLKEIVPTFVRKEQHKKKETTVLAQ